MKFLKTFKSREGNPIDFKEIEFSIEKCCRKFDIWLLYIFGSYAFDKAYKLSDLDIAFLPHHKLDLDKTLGFLNEFQDIFQEEAIDLVDLKKAPLSLIHRVFKEGRCLYARDLRTRIEFEVRSESLYYDTEPLRKKYFEALERRIEDGSFGYR